MFTQNPRGWMRRVYSENEFSDFRRAREKSTIGTVIVHSPYLPNLCTSNAELYRKSSEALTEDLKRCEKLGADYLVIHPGAFSPDHDAGEGVQNLINAFNAALETVPGRSMLLIENMAGGGRRVGDSFASIAAMRRGVKDKSRVGVCFDTCHAFAAGYDVRSPRGIKATLDEFDREIGLEHLKMFHVNDSKGPLGCRRDRHENLGEGHIGMDGFKTLFSARDFSSCAFILETPKEPMPQADLKNLKALRSCL
jgi:deoxyribonuclease-4